jgi:hypothetical protein
MKKNIKKAQMGGAYASRRAYKSAGATKPSTGTTKSSSPQSSSKSNNISNVNRNDGYADYMKTVDSKPVDTVKSTPAKAEGNKGGASTRQRAAVATSKANTPAPNRQQKITPIKGLSPIALPERKKPTVAREYSESERKIMSIMNKGKQADGTMSTSAQAKIAATRAKERAEKMKAERKENRAGNKSNKATNKTISRISKVNKKPKK